MTLNRNIFIIIIVGLVAFCINNSYIVPDIMESRNLITAREMVTEGNWIVPTMNDELRLEKPPLPTWISALTIMAVGDSWNAFRFIPGLMGILILIYVYLLAKRMTGKEEYALASSLILATCYNFVLASRTVTWDIYCHAFMMMSIYYQYRLYSEERGSWKNATLAGIGLGLSILSKGPVSLYALWLPFIIASAIMGQRDALDNTRKKETLTKTLYFVLLGLAIGGWWYGYIWYQESAAGLAVLNKESGSWVNHNVRPWYYYATFFTETGIWIPVCIASLAVTYWKGKVIDKKNYLYSFAWMIACLVLLSCLPEKKNRYLLPILIPASMTMAYLIVYWAKNGKKILWVVVALFALIELFGMPLLAKYFSNTDYSCPKALLDQQYKEVPVFHSDKDTIRIELVYDLGRSIHAIDLTDSVEVASRRPFLLIRTNDSNTTEPSAENNIQLIGHYNANRQSTALKKDRPMFYYDLFFVE